MNEHLAHAWRRAQLERIDRYLAVEQEQRVFKLIGNCDPTPIGKYHNWLSRWRRAQWTAFGIRYICSAFDLAEAGHALQRFERIRPTLPVQQRDTSLYPDPEELLLASPVGFSRARAREMEKAEALAGSDVLFDCSEWKLVRLKDRTAAVWWGKGTRWCTSARSENQFASYAAAGDLFVLITPLGRYQYHPPTKEFRDASDAKASLRQILAAAPAGYAEALPRKP